MNASAIHAVTLAGDEKVARWIAKFQCEVVVALNLFQWHQSLCHRCGNVGILEVQSTRSFEEIQQRIELAYTVQRKTVNQTTLIAVTDTGMSQYKKELLISGFANVFCSYSEINKFGKMLDKHAARVSFPEIALTSKVRDSLPWNSPMNHRSNT